MTRGQKGCYIYCVDKALADYMRSRINRGNGSTYSIDEDEEIDYNLIVAEDSEEYRYE